MCVSHKLIGSRVTGRQIYARSNNGEPPEYCTLFNHMVKSGGTSIKDQLITSALTDGVAEPGAVSKVSSVDVTWTQAVRESAKGGTRLVTFLFLWAVGITTTAFTAEQYKYNNCTVQACLKIASSALKLFISNKQFRFGGGSCDTIYRSCVCILCFLRIQLLLFFVGNYCRICLCFMILRRAHHATPDIFCHGTRIHPNTSGFHSPYACVV